MTGTQALGRLGIAAQRDQVSVLWSQTGWLGGAFANPRRFEQRAKHQLLTKQFAPSTTGPSPILGSPPQGEWAGGARQPFHQFPPHEGPSRLGPEFVERASPLPRRRREAWAYLRPGKLDVAALAREADFRDRTVVGEAVEAPFVSVIWALVERDELGSARRLLAQLPDEPRYRLARRLLRPPRTSTLQQTGADRTADFEWLSRHAKEHAHQWVAVSGGSLVATAKTLKVLRETLRQTPQSSKPLLHYVE